MLVYRSVNVPTKNTSKRSSLFARFLVFTHKKTESVGLNPEVVGTIESSISHVPNGAWNHGEFSWDRIRKTITKKENKSKIFGGFRHINPWLLITLVGMITLKQIQVNHQNYRGAKTETMLTWTFRWASAHLQGKDHPHYPGFQFANKGCNVGIPAAQKCWLSSRWWRIESWGGGVCLLHSKKIITTP